MGGLICEWGVSRRLFRKEFQESDEKNAELQETKEKMFGEKV